MKIKREAAAVFLIAVLFFLAAGPIPAQVPPQRRNTRENILTLMLLRMTQVLELTEEQAAQFYPLVNRLEKQKLALARDAARLVRDLRMLIRENRGNEQEMKRLIDQIKALRQQMESKDREVEAFVEESLTVEQQAKFLIFFQDFNQYLRQKLREAQKRQPAPPVKKSPSRRS